MRRHAAVSCAGPAGHLDDVVDALAESPVPPTPPGDAAPSRWGVLRHAHFRLVLTAGFGSWIGGWLEFVAIRWIVSQETKSEEWMGYLLGAQLFPTLVLGMLGGLVADSVNRRTLLILTQGAMLVIALAMAYAAYGTPAGRWVWLGLGFAQGVAIAFNTPAWQVLTPRLVPKNEIVRAITMNGIVFNLARVVGPALGGVILKAAPGSGAATLLLVNAAMFAAVMVAVWFTPDAPAPPEMRGKWKHPGEVYRRTLEAASWVRTRRGPRAVFWAIVVFALLATPVMQLMPLMVSEVYGAAEDTFGTLITIMGLGAVTGGLAMKWVPKWYPMHHLIPLSVTMGGVWILIYALCESPFWAMWIIFPLGFFWMWGFNSTSAAIQHLVDDGMRGRVSAVVNTVAMGLMPLGTLGGSVIAHAAEWGLKRTAPALVDSGTETQLALAIPAVVLIGAGLVMIIWRTPEVDGLAAGDPGFERVPGFWRGVLATAHRPTKPEFPVKAPPGPDTMGP